LFHNLFLTLINSKKKYLFVSFALLVYLSGGVGVFSSLYLNFHRSAFQSLVTDAIPANTLKLIFSETDFANIHWISVGREFEWNDKMYDVSKIEKVESEFQVYCINDTEEESLLGFINSWKQSVGHGTKVKFGFQPLFCIDLNFPKTPKVIRDFNSTIGSFFYNPPVERAPSPPPKSTFSKA